MQERDSKVGSWILPGANGYICRHSSITDKVAVKNFNPPPNGYKYVSARLVAPANNLLPTVVFHAQALLDHQNIYIDPVRLQCRTDPKIFVPTNRKIILPALLSFEFRKRFANCALSFSLVV